MRDLMAFLNTRFDTVKRHHVAYHLQKLENEQDENISARLRAIEIVSFTSDCWNDEKCNLFASLIAHFIENSWTMKSHRLCCSRLSGKHTGETISRFIVDSFRRFEILSNILCISMDSA